MNTEKKKPSIEGTMRSIITHLNSPQERRNLAGDLAAIRNSTGKKFEDATAVWPILFPLLPAEYLGNGPLTKEEKALLLTLQLYAIGQQGTEKLQEDEAGTIGSSFQKIRGPESEALDRRFNTMLTATTFEEFAYHLRQIFKQGKSHTGFSVNFPKLSSDLFWYQNGRSKQICLKWARDYYRSMRQEDQIMLDSKDNQS